MAKLFVSRNKSAPLVLTFTSYSAVAAICCESKFTSHVRLRWVKVAALGSESDEASPVSWARFAMVAAGVAFF